jgi:hypothetical protein
MGLRHGDAEEPAALAIRLRIGDARRRPSPGLGGQGQVPWKFQTTGARHPTSLVSAINSSGDNPGALVSKHLEADGRMALTGKDDFNRKLRSAMRQRQNIPRNPPSNTPHECAATHGLINPIHQIARRHKFLYLSGERYQFATAHRFASFA